jgi:hypothetical protein
MNLKSKYMHTNISFVIYFYIDKKITYVSLDKN